MTSEPAPAPGKLRAGQLVGRLWREFARARWRGFAALAPVLMVVAATGTAYAFIIRETISRLETQDLSVLTFAPVAILTAATIRALAIWGQAVLGQSLGQAVLKDLQGAMFQSLMRADFARLQAEPAGKLVTRFTSDINIIAEGMVRGVQVALRDVLTVVGAIASIFFFDWVLALVVLGVFALSAGPLAAIARRARAQTERAQRQLGELSARLTESLSSPRFIKTFQLEAQENARAEAVFEERRRQQMKLTYNRARTDPLMEVLGALALVGVTTLAGWRIISGGATLADLTAIITAVATASPAARSIGAYNTIFNEAVAALHRVYALLDEAPKVVDRPGAVPLRVQAGRVAFADVAFAYGDKPVLRGVSFVAEPGARVALVGPSGAGKSSILNLIPRLYDVTGGGVLIDGTDVRDVQLQSLRAQVAVVSQDVTLFEGTIGENILFGRPGADRAAVIAAAEAAAADAFIRARPGGYDSPVGPGGAGLSGGERQRIALARAFLKDAPILLLDEATSALDAETEALVQEALARLSAGRTTLVVAHRLATVRAADLILALEDGRIVARGAHAELMAAGGLYARLTAAQEGG